MGRVSFPRLHPLISSEVLGHVDVDKVDCHCHKLAKFHALPFKNNDIIFQAPFDLVHSNIWGPSPNTSMSGL